MQKPIVDRAADFARRTLFEADVQIARDRVVLRLWRNSDALCVLERRLVRSDDVVLTQILSLEDGDALAEFAAADPYGDHLRAQYQSVDRERREQIHHQTDRKARYRPVDPVEEIDLIDTCSNEAELMNIAGRVVGKLGGQSYVYHWLRVNEKTGGTDESRSLVGCHPAWLHRYINRLWYRRDPFLEYAKRNAASTVGSRIDLSNDDDSLMSHAVEYGFRSSLVCPAHSRSNAWVGVLQVSNEQPQPKGESALWKHRVLLRALALALLDWHLATLRHDATNLFNLDQRELAALRMVRAGRTALNVADSLGVSERTAYAIFTKINGKLGAPNITKAAETAVAIGLIE
ncbi:UNVERIFIED_ORG: DNA-binding CsgD family transcriptional regulator [Burkholderia sp. 1595]|uniref:DNA-binding CsgD family transcriptional regulator n=1 Tax=Paraburkholderia terricola TaxID=169427 RepID=A0ABU1M0A5_9BURK|nr:autoinducer binding domain-containing protein [Paraburkholderia terricola]MDR6412160.1 DNA-binding CsgD family transcriptional regulator [Paraburkholderia terricola]